MCIEKYLRYTAPIFKLVHPNKNNQLLCSWPQSRCMLEMNNARCDRYSKNKEDEKWMSKRLVTLFRLSVDFLVVVGWYLAMSSGQGLHYLTGVDRWGMYSSSAGPYMC